MKTLFKNIIITAFLIITISSNLFSQYRFGGLQIDPSINSNGIGSAGIALIANDAYSIYHNPAMSSFSDTNNIIALSLYPSNLNSIYYTPYESIWGPTYYSFALTGNTFLGKNKSGINIGLGYFLQRVNLGEFTRTAPDGKVLGKFTPIEVTNNINLSASYEYFLKFGIGLNTKICTYTDFTAFGALVGKKTTLAFDLGLLISTPEFEKKVSQNLNWTFGGSLGIIINNYGDKTPDGDLFPRTSGIGYTLNTALKGKLFEEMTNYVKITYSSQVTNLNVKTDSLNIAYTSLFSNIKLIDNLFLQKKADWNKQVSVNYGIRISFLDFISFSFGYIDSYKSNIYGNHDKTTNGLSFNLNALLKLLIPNDMGKTLNFIRDNLEIEFSESHNKFYSRDYAGVQVTLKNLW
jgi:hypothetical protein